MTPEKLRDLANMIECKGALSAKETAEHYRAFAAALEEIERLREAVELLYDKWENGDDCHEVSGDEMGVFLGKAFQLSKEEEDAILALLKGIPTPSPMQIVTQHAEQAERRAERLKGLLRSLHALVWGECPSLLNEDSGGSSHLDADIRAEIKGE